MRAMIQRLCKELVYKQKGKLCLENHKIEYLKIEETRL